MPIGNQVLLVISSGLKIYRDYLLTAAARRAAEYGYDLWLVNGTRPTWQQPYVAGCTVVNVHDHDRLAAAVREVAARHPVVGLVCWDEPLVIPSAYLAEELDVPGLGVDGVLGCRDKHRTRRLLAAGGQPQPACERVTDADQARRVAARIGYPVVVKPQALGASIGVRLAADESALDEAFRVAADASLAGDEPFQGGALVEGFLDGPEISIDAVVSKGEVLPMFVARKQTGLAPYFEELGHIVDAADPLLTDEAIVRLLADAHRLLAVADGITHTEIKLTSRGPAVVEVNGRLGGDLIPYLGKLATGLDPGAILVDVATGARPDLQPRPAGAAGIRFAYPDRDCRARAVTVPEPDEATGVVTASPMVAPGEELRLPPRGYLARHAFVVCRADDPVTCDARLTAALDRVRLTGEALAPPPEGAPFQMPTGLLDVDPE